MNLQTQVRQMIEWIVRYSDISADDLVEKNVDQLRAIGQPIKREVESFAGRRYSQLHNTFGLNWMLAKCPLRHSEMAKNLDLDLCHQQWRDAYNMLLGRVKQGAGFTIAMVGTRGGGKTQLSVCLIRACCVAMQCRYLRVSDLFRERSATYAHESRKTEAALFNEYGRVPLLVLDKSHQRGETAAENNLLVSLIDARYGAKLDTILIANQSKADFAKSIGDSVVSRMNETGLAIECNWPSYRTAGAISVA